MKYKTILSFALSLLLVISSLPVYSASFEDGVGKDEIPYGPFDNAQYKYQTFNMMTAAEAKAAGVPDGYSGNVLKLTAGGGAGGGKLRRCCRSLRNGHGRGEIPWPCREYARTAPHTGP